MKYIKHPPKTKKRTVHQELQHQDKSINTVLNNDFTQKVQIMLPYNGKQGNKVLSNIKKHLKKLLPNDVKRSVTYGSNNPDTSNHRIKQSFINKTTLLTL